MNLLAAGILLAFTIRSPHLTIGDDELIARYEAGCTGRAAQADCGQLQRELEVRLFADLRELEKVDTPIDRDVIQVAAAAEFPFLAVLGLQLMQQVEGPEDEAAVVWAMDHPSPGVRYLARRMARASDRPGLRAQLAWGSDHAPGSTQFEWVDNDDWSAAMMPEPLRWLDEFGLPSYAATFRPSMSGPNELVFTTTDPPARVVAVVAKGRQTISGMEYAEKAGEAFEEMDTSAIDEIAKQMEGVTDLVKISELTQQMTEAMLKMMKPMTERAIVRDMEGRYFELPLPGDAKRQRTVGIGRDAALGLTTISVTPP